VKKATSTANATVTVTAVATNSSLSGQYGFHFEGFDASGDYYAAAGSVTLDGNGNVTAGEEDFNDDAVGTPSVADALSGTYTVGNDGQGTMTLNAVLNGTVTADPNVGVGGVQTLAFTVVNNNHLLVAEFDSAFTSGGVMDLQTASAFTTGVTGNYAYTGTGFLSGSAISFGGVLNSTGTALTGPVDQDITGSVASGITSGAVSTADANGRGTLGLGSLSFAYYVIGPEVAYFVEIDPTEITVGAMYGQGSAPNFSAASLSGNYVAYQPEADSAPGFSVFGGQFAADGTSALAGVADYNEGGFVPAGEPTPDAFNASYATASNGYGSISGGVVTNDSDYTTWGLYFTDPALNLTDPNSSSGGGGALINEIDSNALGIGIVVPQSATVGNVGNSGFNVNGFDYTDDVPNNSVGQVYAGGTGTSSGSFSVNHLAAQASAQTFTAVITADSTNAGRYELASTSGSTTANFVGYQVSSSLQVQIDVDASSTFTQVAAGVVESQQ
jgi:hypothetical protein